MNARKRHPWEQANVGARWDNEGEPEGCANTTPGSNQTHLEQEGGRLMGTILPLATRKQDEPRRIDWMSRLDGCPDCVSTYETPRDVAPTADGTGFYAGYLCAECGYAWITSWDAA